MAWNTPRDWTGITDNIVTAAMLNADVRDNLTVLGTHTHTGAAGMGSNTMSGITFTNLVTLTFADQSANPDAAGELQRNGNDLLWYNGSAVVNFTAVDAAAGTGSLRTLNTTATSAAAGNHTHVPASPNQIIDNSGVSINTDTETDICSETIVVQGASEAIAVFSTFLFQDAAGSNAYTIRLKYSGPTSGTVATRTSMGNTGGDAISELPASGTASIITPTTAGTYTIKTTVQRTSGSDFFNAKSTLYAREVGA